jgi:hypothetical protein
MTEQYFVLTARQVRLLGLDEDLPWWGLLGQYEDGENLTYVTADETAFDTMAETARSGVQPPEEFAAWVGTTLVVIDGWPTEW